MQHQILTVPLTLKGLKARQIEGHGSVFGNVDLGGDVVVRGAFRETLATHKAAGTMPQMFFMHNWDQVPGRWDEMAEDDTGLSVTGTLAKTQLGDEIRTLAEMKAVRGLSIGYHAEDVDYGDDGVRLIKQVDLVEVSIVSLAMNPLAAITASKARLSATGEYVPTRREFERKLRDVGLSQSTAKKLVASAFDSPSRDVDGLETDSIAEMIELCGQIASDMQVAAIKNITTRI